MNIVVGSDSDADPPNPWSMAEALEREERYADGLQRELETLVAPLFLARVRWVVERLAAGERDPQCRATWPEKPTRETGYAACQFREGHSGLHTRPDGARWENGGQLLLEVSVDEEFDEQARLWLSEQMCANDSEVAEYAAYLKLKVRRT